MGEEVGAALAATDKDVWIGEASLAAAAIESASSAGCACSAFRSSSVEARPFLPPVTEVVSLDLVETRTFGSRVIYERYRQTRDEPD